MPIINVPAGGNYETKENVKTEINNHNTSNNAHQGMSFPANGGNADTVDGKHASEFATSTQGTKADNALPKSSYTASDILTKLKTVDGTGSGLDADLLNGKHSSNFAESSQITSINTVLNNKVDKVSGKGLSTNDFTAAYKSKIDGIQTGAEVNVQSDWNVTATNSDAYIKNKPTSFPANGGNADTVDGKHASEFATALQVTTINTTLNSKVDKITGKGLSTNDFTAAYKTKLDGIQTGAESNVQSDWNITNTTSDAFIKNKPITLPTYTSYTQFPNYSGETPIAIYESANTWRETLQYIFNMMDYTNIGFIYVPNSTETEELYNQKVRPENALNLGNILDMKIGIPMYVFIKSRHILHVEYIISINNTGKTECWECSYSGRTNNTLSWTKTNDGGNADTIDGRHADDFIINYGVVSNVNDYCSQSNPCIIKWNDTTLNSPLKTNVTSAATGVIYVNTVTGDWTTMLAFPDGQNNIYIKSFHGSNLVKDWESLRNADTVDGKHANDFLLKSEKSAASSTIVIAAANSLEKNKATADYICTGTKDNVIIQQAVNSISKTGGKICFLEGTYNINTSIKIEIDNITIEGMGFGTIFNITAPMDGIHVLANNFIIKDLKIIGGGTGQILIGDRLSEKAKNINTIKILNVYFDATWKTAVYAEVDSLNNIVFDNVECISTQKNARSHLMFTQQGFKEVKNLIIRNSHIDVFTENTESYVVFFYTPPSYVNISNNYGSGKIDLTTNSSNDPSYMILKNNIGFTIIKNEYVEYKTCIINDNL